MIDCRGHYKGREQYVEDNIRRSTESWLRSYSRLIGEKEAKEAVFSLPLFTSSDCHNCGRSIEFFSKDQGETYIAEDECKYKDGFPPIETLFKVSSGVILLFNDFRHDYTDEEKMPYFNINTMAGQKAYSEYYAERGLIMHFVGNTCPDVVQVSDERLDIGCFYCEHEDGCELPECPSPSCKIVNKIGSICTDLWWYCAVDQSEFEHRIGKTTEKYEKEYHATGAWPEIIRAKVTPGLYRAVGQYHIDEDKLFSYIEKIGNL